MEQKTTKKQKTLHFFFGNDSERGQSEPDVDVDRHTAPVPHNAEDSGEPKMHPEDSGASEKCSTDIQSYASLPLEKRKSFTDQQKLNLLTTDYKPPKGFSFPGRQDHGNRGFMRHFQSSWLEKYNWLVYSKVANGGFCLPCVLFGQSKDNSELGVLVSRPLTNFRKALDEIKDHDTRPTHRVAVTKADDFLRVMRGEQQPVTQQIDTALARRVQENRKRLVPVIKTIILCGRQNIPLRGHDDSANKAQGDPHKTNHGNFWALLNFRVDAGDKELANHLATAPKNARYTSATIQNEIIEIVGNEIRNKIIDKVKKAKFFTVLADEVTDEANMEQLSIVLRYVDPETEEIAEDLVNFVECDTGVTGKALADNITRNLQLMGLDLRNLRGQGYDGAANMSGKTKGAASIIAAEYPLAVYMHCASHSLNLVIVKSCSNVSIRNMMAICKKIFDFFDVHPKRQVKLEKAIEDTQPDTNKTKIKRSLKDPVGSAP